MSDDATTLMAHLVPRLTGQVENAATDALGYILNKSATSRDALTDLLGEGGFDMPPIARVETQVTYEDGKRPDMVGYDETGVRRLIVESKFWASLQERQASGYLQQIDEDGPTALLFIAPEVRLETLWTEIVRQIREESPEATLRPETPANGWRSAMVEGVPKRLALVSWDRLLRGIADRAGDDGVIADVRQLRGLARRQDAEAFLPVRAEELSPDFARRAVGYTQLVDDVVNRGVSQGWMSLKGLRGGAQRYGYGRHIRFVETEKDFWFGVNHERWARSGDTPLWLCDDTATADKRWSPVHVKTGVERLEVLDAAASKVKELAAASKVKDLAR